MSSRRQDGGIVAAVDAALRAFVNASFRDKDPYDVVRRLALACLVLQLGQRLRDQLKGDGIVRFVMDLELPWIKRIPFVREKLRGEMLKVQKSVEPSLLKDQTEPRKHLPKEGRSEAELMARRSMAHFVSPLQMCTHVARDGRGGCLPLPRP